MPHTHTHTHTHTHKQIRHAVCCRFVTALQHATRMKRISCRAIGSDLPSTTISASYWHWADLAPCLLSFFAFAWTPLAGSGPPLFAAYNHWPTATDCNRIKRRRVCSACIAKLHPRVMIQLRPMLLPPPPLLWRHTCQTRTVCWCSATDNRIIFVYVAVRPSTLLTWPYSDRRRHVPERPESVGHVREWAGPGVISRGGTRRNALPSLLKCLRINALWSALRTIFRPKMH